jgi:hypothetical protein
MDIAWVDILDEDKLESKHHVHAFEAEQVLLSKPRVYFVEKGRIEGEDVYLALGQTDAGRYLAVFFIYKQNRVALVISAPVRWMQRSADGMPGSKESRDPLPESFETIDEFVEFWDTHSTADYPEAFREVEGEVRVERRRYYGVTLDAPLGAQLAQQAQVQGVTLDTLVNRLLKEHLRHFTHVS